jgi:Protein of unknown function (DUF2934)
MHPIRIFVGVLFSANVEWKPQSKGEMMAKTRESSSPTEQKTRAGKNHPTQEEIALRAYQIYLERGATPGYELEDWTEAERQLLATNGKAGENGKPRRKPKAKSAIA